MSKEQQLKFYEEMLKKSLAETYSKVELVSVLEEVKRTGEINIKI